MKVAIMGAGLSGLACAITLEKHGVTPAIFEKRSSVGDRFVNAEALLSLFTRPVNDCIASLSEHHGIFLHPIASIAKMTVYSKHEKVVLDGQLGFTNVRGREKHSFEAQLGRQVRSKIHVHSEKTYEELLADYTHVVLATGDSDYAKKNRNFREDLTVSIKGATVEGRFDPYEVKVWLDYEIAPFGYGYLIPFSEKEANLVIAIPDLPESNMDMEFLWSLYYPKVQAEFQQELPITDQFQITGYPIGICHSGRVGNTFYVGNNFGAMMPFMGFGQYAAWMTGIYAAHDLCGIGHYEDLTQPIRQSYENSIVLRRSMEHLSSESLDVIVRNLNSPWGKKLLTSPSLNTLKIASYLLRPFIRQKS
ncbi:NAD(P)/FAD-dependent oxidoreductase [Gorillibacterium sp. CAU 1737]|uniref:NAD(P)/FAD-dependent oxidoreductase n=1 Tax=Gorillibacterium sp. CAU 1737 TaxID=3140362 RepID=UPI0032602752